MCAKLLLPWSSWSSGAPVLERPLGVDDRLERLVVDLDQLAGVFRDVAGRGDHRGDRLADVADTVEREQRAAPVRPPPAGADPVTISGAPRGSHV